LPVRLERLATAEEAVWGSGFEELGGGGGATEAEAEMDALEGLGSLVLEELESFPLSWEGKRRVSKGRGRNGEKSTRDFLKLFMLKWRRGGRAEEGTAEREWLAGEGSVREGAKLRNNASMVDATLVTPVTSA